MRPPQWFTGAISHRPMEMLRTAAERECQRERELRRRGGRRRGERKNDCVHEEDREVHFNRCREKTRKEKVRGNAQAIMNDLLDASGTLCAPDGLFLLSCLLPDSWAANTHAPNVLQLNLLTYLKQHRTAQQNWLKYCISEFNAEQSETNVMAEFLNSRAPSERG